MRGEKILIELDVPAIQILPLQLVNPGDPGNSARQKHSITHVQRAPNPNQNGGAE
jgi:hypothetical protein